jgi:hypothetical protein
MEEVVQKEAGFDCSPWTQQQNHHLSWRSLHEEYLLLLLIFYAHGCIGEARWDRRTDDGFLKKQYELGSARTGQVSAT